MPKCNRIVIPDLPHHICHRGNLGQDVFFLDSDRTLYLGLLNEHSQVHRVTIQAYCLMSNHIHVIATPQDSSGLHRTFQRVQGDYARALHTRLNRRGNLWHGRFRSAAMDEDYFWAAMVYVEQNPVRAGIVTSAEAWTWSSARAHAEEYPDTMLDLTRWRTRYTAERWKECLKLGLRDSSILERIRQSTKNGRPAASEAFLRDLETSLGVRLCPKRTGRPAANLRNAVAG